MRTLAAVGILTFLPLPVAAAEAPPPPKRAQFSLAFAVRPWAPPNLMRLDTAVAFDSTATTVAPTFTAGGVIAKSLGIYARLGLAMNTPSGAPQRSGLANPAVFALYAPEVAPKTRVPIFVAVAFPIGEGGGDAPDKESRAALGAGVYARQAMDNALFAPNYFATALGAGLSRVDAGWTFQIEATLFQLFRARGAEVDAESTRTNLTSGANVGYAIADTLNLNVEVHYQRSLSTPANVEKDPPLRDQLTIGGGARLTFVVGEGTVLRPGIGYFQGIDAPMSRNATRIVQIDLPIVL